MSTMKRNKPTCINLAERFGDRFKIGWDPAYNPRNRPKANRDPWMMLVLCRRGSIYPQGGDVLAADVDGNRALTRNKLVAMGCKLLRDGDDGFTVLFHVDDFDAVAEIVKPRKRRIVTMTPERRESLARARSLSPICS